MIEILDFFSEKIKRTLAKEFSGGIISEIRLCLGKPVLIVANNRLKALSVTADRECMEYSVARLTRGSLYSTAECIKHGYITVAGGHRVGIGGTAVTENGVIKNIKDISFLCFRIAREVRGCALMLAPHTLQDGRVLNCLIVSPPGYGKTTIIRDIARIFGDGLMTDKPLKVGIADERREICPDPEDSRYVGLASFVLGGYPRADAMEIMIRTMSPDVVITDEIGSMKDFEVLGDALRCGVSVIATAHGKTEEEVRERFGKKINYFDKIFLIGDKTGKFTEFIRKV